MDLRTLAAIGIALTGLAAVQTAAGDPLVVPVDVEAPPVADLNGAFYVDPEGEYLVQGGWHGFVLGEPVPLAVRVPNPLP